MLAMHNPIELYEEMTTLSARMVEAARRNDWDNLIELERSVGELRLRIAEDDDNGRLDSRERERKAALIQRILADDAEIRRHTEPWMEQVRQFLGGARRKRQVDQTYGAHNA
ncbi:MAG TPA: flagellar protein FliT [Rhodocyclaceae bacterium]|jgi:flagellar protein FliT|nr:flagellar protein FliT [Rhodocyclaceae bacterium]